MNVGVGLADIYRSAAAGDVHQTANLVQLNVTAACIGVNFSGNILCADHSAPGFKTQGCSLPRDLHFKIDISTVVAFTLGTQRGGVTISHGAVAHMSELAPGRSF